MSAEYLDVPGARLSYELRGDGPLLFMIGSPMDGSGFAGMAHVLAHRYTVVTYDPRGIGASTREDSSSDITPEQQAGDVHRLIASFGRGPADVFGSSGGGTVGLALVTAHPDAVRTLVAHEPPVIDLLPDRDQLRAQIQDVYDTYRAEGADQAMPKFMAHAGLGDPFRHEPGVPDWQPPPAQLARMRAANEVFLAHLLRPTTNYRPDLAALQAASTRIVVGVGRKSTGQLAWRTGQALAGRLGTTPVEFPGDHAGFVTIAAPCAMILHELIRDPR